MKAPETPRTSGVRLSGAEGVQAAARLSLAPYTVTNVALLVGAIVVLAAIASVSAGAPTPARGWPNWALWVPALVTIGVPILGLLLDRVADIPAPRFFRWVGIPSAVIFAAVTLVALVQGDPLFTLILWGVIGALLGSVLLDIVRLFGLHVLKAFPMDMPMMFGLIVLGLVQRMQTNMMVRMVEVTANLPPEERRRAMEARVHAMARLTPVSRGKVARGMVAGLGRLPLDKRDEMLQTQLSIVADLDPGARRAMMRSMDEAMSGTGPTRYGQPWGMLRIPMANFRAMAAVSLPRTAVEGGKTWGTIAWAGYSWHFVNGISLIAPYTLLFGPGNWPLALAWGVFIWIGMMGFMPFMMRMVHFPWWFPVIPFIAHLAMMLPLALLAPVFVQGPAIDASLLGRFFVGK